MGTMNETQDLVMVYDSAMSFLSGVGGLARMRRLRFTESGLDRDVWRNIAEMGWPGVLLAESEGGIGLGMAAYSRIAIAAGRYLLPEPLVATVLAASIMVDRDLSALLNGESIILPAWQESPNQLEPADAIIDGGACYAKRAFVSHGMVADHYLVSHAAGWVLIAADDEHVTRRYRGAQDGGHYCDLIVDGANVLAEFPPNPLALEAAILAQAAYQLGAALAAYEMTIEYMGTRRQFGKPIGAFQALQHRMADLKIQLELTQASINAAASKLDRTGVSLDEQRAAVSRAKARSSDVTLFSTRQGVQLHGAIGYTDECDIGLFLRSAMVHCPRFGSAALHRARYGQILEKQKSGETA